MAKSFKDVFDDIEKAYDRVFRDKVLKAVGEAARDMVKIRTRLGYGSDDGKKITLDPLSPNYKKFRKRYNKLSGNTTPSKSNLTLTGAMLDGMSVTVNDLVITIGFEDGFNANKAKWNAEKGRPFMQLTEQETQRITDIIQKAIDDEVKKLK